MERRLAAILAADMVGYSRLMAADEAGTLARQKTYRTELIDPKIAEYGGRVVKTTGDGVLVEFPSVVDALRCAVTIQLAMLQREAAVPEETRIAYRIGINLGDIIVEDDDIYGDGVNVAARLEALAEPGGVCVSRTVVNHVRGKVSSDFDDLGEQSLKNIPEPVHVFRVLMMLEEAGEAVVEVGSAKWWKRPVAAIAVAGIVLVIAVAGIMVWQPWAPDVEPASVERMAFPLPDAPSIAVLPFESTPDDQGPGYFADGLTEDIITELSRFPELFVIARGSSFTYKNEPAQIRQIAEDLGVRYVLNGSIRKSDETVRITSQLIDATSGRHIWAEHYDRNLSDFFTIQDEIVATIVTTLAVELEASERTRIARKPTSSLKAYDYFLQGRDLQLKSGFWRQDINEQARGLYARASELDPRFTRAVVELAWTYLYEFIFGWNESPDDTLARAYEFAQESVSMDATEPRAHYALGYVELYRRQHDRAKAAIEKAITLNPNDARFRAGMAGFLIYSGEPGPAIEQMNLAMRRNPHHEDWYFHFLAWANYHAQHYDEALAALNRIARPGAGDHRMFAAVYVRLDQLDEARSHVAEASKLEPDSSISHFAKSLPYKKPPDLEFYLDALRKAGVPEHPPLPLPDKPSIAVLPFTNMSDDPGQDYFADGMTDDLITDLSKLSGLFVIARNSSFSYKGQQVKVQQVAEELGVRYVLEGSVRRAGNQVRINAQLIDVTTGGHVWAERYDGSLTNVFALQDKVTRNIVTALAVNLTAGERERQARKETDSPEAYDAFLRGWAHYRLDTAEDFAKSVPYFEQAIELDPNYGRAHAALAAVYQESWDNDWVKSLGMSFTEAGEKARRHLEEALKDPTPLAHRIASRMHTSGKRWDEAVAEAERAIALDANDPNGYEAMGRVLVRAGRPAEGLEFIETAMRLDPQSDYLYRLGEAQFHLERYDEAAATLLRAAKRNPDVAFNFFLLAAAYGQLGREQEAESAIETFNKMRAKAGEHLMSLADIGGWRFKNSAERERLREGLRKAGLPE